MELYENRQFMIFSTIEIEKIDFLQVCETSKHTLRFSIDGTKTFVKWDGNTIPSSVDSLTTKQGPYTYTEIIDILNGPEWTSNEMI